MMEIGESCKLCLKYVQGTNMAVLDETILGKLEFLQMDLDQSVEDSNSVCKECEERIEKAFDFKSCLVNTESCLVPYVCEDKTQKVNLKVVIEKDNSSMSIGETSTEKEVCRLCKNFVDAIAVISLPKILKDDNVTEVFQGHIPEMDLEVTENPVVCEKCQKSLASFSTLVASWSIANGMNEMEGDEDEDVKGEFEPNFEMVKVKNETIDDFSDSNTTSSTSMLEISDSAKTVKKTKKGKSATVKTEPDSSDIVSALNREIKTENGEEDESMEDDLQLKSEEVEIKDEDGYSVVAREYNNSMEGAVHTTKKKFKTLNCQDFHLQTYETTSLNNHSLIHTILGKMQTFESQNISSDVRSYKCTECSYLTVYKSNMKRHLLVHKAGGEVNIFKCDKCVYETKEKSDLKEHRLTHNGLRKIKTFKCVECPFQTKYKSVLKIHSLRHKSLSEIQSYKCDECTYVTIYKLHLKRHYLTHRNLSEIDTFKCTQCFYEAKDKSALKKHGLLHKSLGEVATFKCAKCLYETKDKAALKRHDLTHKSLSETRTFKCTYCPYVTKYKSGLKEHGLTHKDLNEVVTFKCAECNYVTKRKSNLKTHVLKHINISAMNSFKCAQCSYVTMNKSYLRKHCNRHKTVV